MQHFIFFVGRFHVLALHLPIALVLVVAALEWQRRAGGRPELEPALRILWAATAATAVLTALLGYLHFSEGGFTGSSAHVHRALGTSVAVFATLAWWLRTRPGTLFNRTRALLVPGLVVLVVLTGHFGGNLTHGNTYLVKYAPAAIRRIAGLEAVRVPVTSLASADPYLDVVQPILAAHCSSCHNSDKQGGGLDLSGYSSTMKGGDDGPVIVAGNSKASDLIRRLSLPADDDDSMPKEGKAPLSADQLAIVRWWIDAGARTGLSLAAQPSTASIRTLLESQLRLGSGEPFPPTVTNARARDFPIEESAGPARRADSKVIDALLAAGVMARQVSLSDPRLIVSPIATGSGFGVAQIQALVAAGGDQIAELDLRAAHLQGSAIAPLAGLRDLTRLRLDRNELDDAAVRVLVHLDRLQVLGLYGNVAITDASLATLAQMKSLRRVYLWRTAVTAVGVERLRSERPGVRVEVGE